LIKILIITDLFPPDVSGGYELRCEEACNWLHEKGYVIEVLTTESEYKESNHNYHIHRILKKYTNGSTPKEWVFFRRLYFALRDNYFFRKTLKKFKPEFVYLWHCSGISRSLIPELFHNGVPTIVDVSDKWLWKVSRESGPVYGLFKGKSSNFFKHILKTPLLKLLPLFSFGFLRNKYKLNIKDTIGYFTSRWNYDFHLDEIKDIKHFNVYHTGIDLKYFPSSKRTVIKDTITLLYVGRISTEKGIILLLDQVDYASTQMNVSIHLMIAGKYKNEYEEKLVENKINKMGDDIKLTFLGQIKRNKLFRYYQEADFTIFTSICDEAFSRVPLESMACGTPCISTENPGSKELFDIDAPMILLEYSNDSLGKIITTINYDEAEYNNISIKGRKFIEGSFTFDHFMKKIEVEFLKNKRIEPYENR